MPKSDPVTAIRVSVCVFMKFVYVGRAGEQAIGHCHGEHSIISESARGHEQRKVLRLLRLKLVDRSNDIASDGSEHFSGILILQPLLGQTLAASVCTPSYQESAWIVTTLQMSLNLDSTQNRLCGSKRDKACSQQLFALVVGVTQVKFRSESSDTYFLGVASEAVAETGLESGGRPKAMADSPLATVIGSPSKSGSVTPSKSGSLFSNTTTSVRS